jgi:hypothetical protein
MAKVTIHKFAVRATSVKKARALIAEVMRETEIEAKAIVSHGPYATGALAASIHGDGPHVSGVRIHGSVISDLPYAASVHDGAEIHAIFPKGMQGVYRFGRFTGRPKLRFFWRKRGRIVFLPQVPGSRAKIGRSHPGQRGKKFLSDPMRSAGRRHGMRVITYDI